MNYAFDEDHTSIIYSREALDQFNAVLDSWDEDQHASGTTSVGYIKVNFSYDYPENGPRPWPKLRLVHMGKKPTDTEISLTPEDSGKKLGPFASGKYSARIYATNVQPEKQWVPITIQGGRTETLDFVFTPDGTISGYITSAMKAVDRTAGMPAWEFRPEHNTIRLFQKRNIAVTKQNLWLKISCVVVIAMRKCQNNAQVQESIFIMLVLGVGQVLNS